MSAENPHCARCLNQPLKFHALDDVEAWVCTFCGGMWIGIDGFRKAIQSLPPTSPNSAESGPQTSLWEDPKLSCPSCGITMNKGQYAYSSGIVIDRCSQCRGIWLDRGELGNLRVFVNKKVPEEVRLMAQMQARSIGRRMETQQRIEDIRGNLAGSFTSRWSWSVLLSRLRDLLRG